MQYMHHCTDSRRQGVPGPQVCVLGSLMQIPSLLCSAPSRLGLDEAVLLLLLLLLLLVLVSVSCMPALDVDDVL